jgi:hypothetical protein
LGGQSHFNLWRLAVQQRRLQLGRRARHDPQPSAARTNAAELAHTLGVGIEIEYKENTAPNLTGLQAFIDGYRRYLYTDGIGTPPIRPGQIPRRGSLSIWRPATSG